MSEHTNEMPPSEPRSDRQKWARRGKFVLVASGLAAAGLIYRRAPGARAVVEVAKEHAPAAIEATKKYAPRPNKDVSWQPRNAMGQFTKT